MSGAANSFNYSALLRQMWPQSAIYNEILDPTATFYGMVQKDTTMSEITRNIAVGYGGTGGLGSTFAGAKASKQPSQQASFAITSSTYYSLFSIDRLLARRSQNKKTAILPAIARETEMAFASMKLQTGTLLWSNGVGTVAQVSAISGNTITLVSSDDMRKFQNGWSISLSSDNTGVAGLRTQNMPLQISQCARSTAVLTFNVPVTTAIPTAAVNDYVYYYQVYGASQVFQGPQAWVPTAAPSSTAFFGLNRTLDVENLSGWRVSGKNMSPKQAALAAATTLAANSSGRPNYLFLGPTDWTNLETELESAGGALKRIQSPAASINKYSFGIQYDGIEFMGATGPIKAFFDNRVPAGTSWMLDLDTWTFGTVGESPYFDDFGGGEFLREQDADAVQGNIVLDGQCYCEAPGRNAVITYNS